MGWRDGWGGVAGRVVRAGVAGRVGAGWGRVGTVGPGGGGGVAGRVGVGRVALGCWQAGSGGWYVRSYSPKGCLYGGEKNPLRNRVE